MSAIWKFLLSATDSQSIQMPRGARILSVALQREQMCLWALVNPDAERELRRFRVHGTGHQVPSPAQLAFIGTVLMYNGGLVWHVFEEKEAS